jgi:uncharacterized membrane protein
MDNNKSKFKAALYYLKKWFISGLILWIPIAVTAYILIFLFNSFDNAPQTLLEKIFPYFKDHWIPGAGVLLCLILLIITGMLVGNFIGRKLVKFAEKKLLERIPLVKTIYKAMKQISNAILSDSNKSFQRVLMIEYPKKDSYSIAFQTSEPFFDEATQQTLITIFLPTTPNPTSGYVLLIPEEKMRELNMPVEEALRFIISLGVVTPKHFENKFID